MTEQMFNSSLYGRSIEGFMNYINVSVDGWLVNLFLLFAWIATVFVLSKAEWKLPSILAFAFFLTLILASIFSLFTTISAYIIIILIFGLAGSIFWSVINKGN